MRIRLKHFFLILLTFVLVVSAFPASVLAGPQIPPTAEGPGFILPDSPLFFLDEVKQNIRIFLAIRPQDKAEVFNSIAGERIAELRYMLARNNQKGIEISLKGISQNTQGAADSLAEAQFRGNNVEKLAEDINTDIKRRQEGLDVLLASSTGELKTMVLGTQTSVYDSKAKVVNGLSQGKKEIEMKEDKGKQAEEKIKNSSENSKEVLDKLGILKKQTSESFDKSIKSREDVLRKANSSGDKVKIKEHKALLEAEKAKKEKTANLYKKVEEKFKEYKAAQDELNSLLKSSAITAQ
ncbi:MAG: DUF5667 domain-containing protein [Patescibacteria group bacterium]